LCNEPLPGKGREPSDWGVRTKAKLREAADPEGSQPSQGERFSAVGSVKTTQFCVHPNVWGMCGTRRLSELNHQVIKVNSPKRASQKRGHQMQKKGNYPQL